MVTLILEYLLIRVEQENKTYCDEATHLLQMHKLIFCWNWH